MVIIWFRKRMDSVDGGTKVNLYEVLSCGIEGRKEIERYFWDEYKIKIGCEGGFEQYNNLMSSIYQDTRKRSEEHGEHIKNLIKILENKCFEDFDNDIIFYMVLGYKEAGYEIITEKMDDAVSNIERYGEGEDDKSKGRYSKDILEYFPIRIDEKGKLLDGI